MVDQASLELRSLVKQDGVLELSLARVTVPPPKDNEVIVRIEATPINPSDLGLLLSAGDMSSAKVSGKGSETVVTAPVAPVAMRALSARVGKSMPVGLEGAGVVISAGASPEAQALLGKTVSTFVGGMYGQFRKVRAADCLVLPAGIKPEWYFLPTYQLLKYFPKLLGIFVSLIPPLVLLLWPFLDRTHERHPRKRPIAVGIGIAALVLAIVFGIIGHFSESTVTWRGQKHHFDIYGVPHRE